MEPPFETKPFEKMSKEEAQLHFEWYLKEIPERVELIKNAYFETNGGNIFDLDKTPQSLKKIWKWFLTIFEVVEKTDKEISEENEAVPDWLNDDIYSNNKKMSMGTQSIAMDIAIYFGEVFINEFEKIKWGYKTKPKSLVYLNKPVLVGFESGTELDPSRVVYNLCLDEIDGETNQNALYELFEIWKSDVYLN